MRIRNRLSVAAVLCATILALAGPASAGGKHWRGKHGGHHGHRGHHERHYDRHEHRHHRGCGHGDHGDGRYGYGYAPRHGGYGHGYPVYHHGGYYCGPCSHHFSSYDGLAAHVHDHHHVAAIALPSLIFQASIGGGMGWVFGDY